MTKKDPLAILGTHIEASGADLTCSTFISGFFYVIWHSAVSQDYMEAWAGGKHHTREKRKLLNALYRVLKGSIQLASQNFINANIKANVPLTGLFIYFN